MAPSEEIENILKDFGEKSPAGFAIGLHLSFTASKFIFQSYDKEWMEEYSRRGYLLNDPTVRWGLGNEGHIAWSDLAASDEAGVIAAAAEFGLTHGLSVSVAEGEERSLGSFASSERAFTDDEVAHFTAGLRRMHELAAGIEADSADDLRLRRYAASLFSA